MLIADWVMIGVFALFCLLGLIVGFGKGLRFFTGGFFGAIIAIIVCYFIGGIVYEFGFVQTLLGKFVGVLTDKNTFCDILISIHIEIIVYYIVLFIVILILRAIIVKIISGIAEINNIVIKIINKVLGVFLFIAAMVMIMFLVFQIVYWIGGSTAESFTALIANSKLKLDYLYENNPLITILKVLVYQKEVIV